MFTKIGAALGTLAFAMVIGTFVHMNYESSKYVPPPTLEQQLSNVVSIYTQAGSYCSGWVLKGTHTIVTAAHCVEPDDLTQPVIVDFEDGTGYHAFHIQKYGDSTFHQGPDLMTLTTNETNIKWPSGLGVCTFKPYYGEELNMMGGPLGYSKSTTFGSVSTPDRNLDDAVAGPFGHFIQYDGALLPGNSGGPVIDASSGCVMGVGELDLVKGEDGVPYMIALLTPASELADLK